MGHVIVTLSYAHSFLKRSAGSKYFLTPLLDYMKWIWLTDQSGILDKKLMIQLSYPYGFFIGILLMKVEVENRKAWLPSKYNESGLCSVSHVFLRRCRLFCQSPSFVMWLRYLFTCLRLDLLHPNIWQFSIGN